MVTRDLAEANIAHAAIYHTVESGSPDGPF